MGKIAEERMKERLMKRIGGKLCERGWYWQGVQFTAFGWLGISGAEAFVTFTAKLTSIGVNIDMEEKYNISDKNKTFTGEHALGEAVEWTAEMLIELYKTIEERTTPYRQGHEEYLRAIKGA